MAYCNPKRLGLLPFLLLSRRNCPLAAETREACGRLSDRQLTLLWDPGLWLPAARLTYTTPMRLVSQRLTPLPGEPAPWPSPYQRLGSPGRAVVAVRRGPTPATVQMEQIVGLETSTSQIRAQSCGVETQRPPPLLLDIPNGAATRLGDIQVSGLHQSRPQGSCLGCQLGPEILQTPEPLLQLFRSRGPQAPSQCRTYRSAVSGPHRALELGQDRKAKPFISCSNSVWPEDPLHNGTQWPEDRPLSLCFHRMTLLPTPGNMDRKSP